MKSDDVMTVIVPVSSVAGYLDDCLRDVEAQTYANLEILVVDDGSFDGSDVLCDWWARRDPRVTVIHQRNRGLSAARNIGFDHASGEYVLFVGPDDVVELTYTEELHRTAEKLRIAIASRWVELRKRQGCGEAEGGFDHARRVAAEHWRDLALPTDLPWLFRILILCVAPGLMPTLRKIATFSRRRGSLQRNAVIYGATTLVNYLLSFLTTFYAARVLAAEALGSASFASSVVGYFSLLASMGIPLHGMRLCAKSRDDPVRLAQVVVDLSALRAVLTAASVALLVLATQLVPRLSDISMLMYITGIGLLAQCASFDWACKGLEDYRYLLARSVATRLIALLLVVAFVHGAGDLYAYAAIYSLSSVCSSLADIGWLRRHVSFQDVVVPRIRRHVRPVLTFFLMSCATLIYANLDTVMLGFMRSATEVGYYQIAVKGKVALTAVGGILWNVALPRATALWAAGDRDGFERLAQRTLRFICLLQAAVTVLLMLAARWVVLFVAGDGYLGAVPAFRILLLTLLPIGVSNIIGGQVLIPAGKERRLLVAEVAGALLNTVCNVALIPVYGIEGAAASTVAAEVIVMLLAYRYAWKDLHVVLFPWDRGLWGALSAAKGLAVRTWYRARGLLIPKGSIRCWCPCCGTRLHAWKEGQFAQRADLYDVRRYASTPQDVVCPVCGSIPRHRIIVWYLGEHPELLDGMDVLHFAPERGILNWLRRHGVRLTTADLYHEADLRLDLQNLDLPDESYDVVICNHVLEHVPDYGRALGELWRVLRPDGLLICSFPVDPRLTTVYEDGGVRTEEGRVEHFGQHDHLRVFGADSGRILERAGFEVDVVSGRDCPDVIRPVVGPADYDSADIFFCRKRG